MNNNFLSPQEDHFRYYGDLLTAHIYLIKKGMAKITVKNYETNQDVTISLKPELSPQENISYFYKKYRKIKDGKENWEKQNQQINDKLDNLNSLYQELERITEFKKIQEFEIKLANLSDFSANITQKDKDKQHVKTIGRMFSLSDQYQAYVSRSAKEADELLKRIAKGNDYWFHIRDYAGSHVIVKKKKNQDITEQVKREAAMLALHFSKAKKAGEGDIYFTQVKYLHKPNTNTPGLVFPIQEKNVKITINVNILENILKNN
ncbi:MAG: NFACT RNA binding domain-containing protein [Spirochaetes bacterium]|nr:NFACT RNA binding domain-containing protein [Spirochaetota bacterium]